MANATITASQSSSSERADKQAHPSHEDIRAHLNRMLTHAEFNASARNRRFLSYVVEETLQGRADRIKAYAIALAVFERGNDFDPLIDPIVRIEASRLRRAIEHYYLTAGKGDAIRIDIPKGSYIPSFGELPCKAMSPFTDFIKIPPAGEGKGEVAPTPEKSHGDTRSAITSLLMTAISAAILVGLIGFGGWIITNRQDQRSPADFSTAAAFTTPQAPSILVVPFENVSADAKYDYVAKGITYELISNLTQFGRFAVYRTRTSFSANDDSVLLADFLISGSVQISGDIMRVNTLLTERSSGRTLWAWNTQRSLAPSRLIDTTVEVTRYVVNVIAQPNGVIQENLRRNIGSMAANAPP